MNEVRNTPELRFPEFREDWTEKKLEHYFSFKNGVNASKGDYGKGYKFINVLDIINNDFITHDRILDRVDISEEAFEKNVVEYGDVLFQRSSETREEVGQSNVYLDKEHKATFGGFVIRGKMVNEYEPSFMHFMLKTANARKEITTKSGGSTRYNVGQETLKAVRIFTTTFEEQQKIASFLTAVDAKIEQLNQKKTLLEQYKKGVMQQLFSQEIRFKDDNGNNYPDWEEKKLGEVLDYEQPTKYLVSSTEYSDEFDIPVLTAGKTFLLGYTNETENVFTENLPVIIFDDFTTATQFVDFPFKAKSSAMKILVPKKGEIVRFIYEAMQLIRFEVGGHGRHWISQYSTFPVSFPCPDEQAKIANFLSAIDAKIELVNTQLENTQQFKKGLLQQLFV